MSEEIELTKGEKRLMQVCCVCCFPLFVISLISRLVDWLGLRRKLRKNKKCIICLEKEGVKRINIDQWVCLDCYQEHGFLLEMCRM